ncbi:DUF4184 family protein [Pontibacter saemangeumensis]|uniref:DUF4184 family protein n=1 Tax=Pontibacter saemangeumensis TaxID=1084525 RepID=UPI0031ED03A7
MPFTFSHPAAVLPFTFLPRKWYSLTGLVVGSMTPDFEYFLRMRVESNYSHTVGGLFWFDLPLGLLLAFIFHNVARDSLFDNQPVIIKSRLIRYKSFDFNAHFRRNWFVVIVSVLIGAASHLLWDSFTHEHGFLVNAIPSLSSTMQVMSWQLPVYKILQHASTLVGGALVALAVWRLPSGGGAGGQASSTYWGVVVGLTVTIMAIRLLSGLDYRLYGHMVVTGISAFCMALILTPLVRRSNP